MTQIATTATAAAATVNTIAASQTVECPECCAEITLTQAAVLHEILPCSDCGAELEVIALDPVQVDLAPEVEEDWGE